MSAHDDTTYTPARILDAQESVRLLRKALGVSQERLAWMIGVTSGCVVRWENSRKPDAYGLAKLLLASPPHSSIAFDFAILLAKELSLPISTIRLPVSSTVNKEPPAGTLEGSR